MLRNAIKKKAAHVVDNGMAAVDFNAMDVMRRMPQYGIDPLIDNPVSEFDTTGGVALSVQFGPQ